MAEITGREATLSERTVMAAREVLAGRSTMH
jgi:hypothetical protein